MIELPPRPAAPLTIGISQCLTGDPVRYDGSGARSSGPYADLQSLYEFVPLCPEMAIGMTVPREPICMVEHPEGIRVVGVKDAGVDKTDDLAAYGRHQAESLRHLSGYVFMHNSPSCGLFRVKVYPPGGGPARRDGRGAYARAFTHTWPELPVEEGGRLFDDVLQENFVMRTFAYAHWQSVADGLTPALLVAFHSAYKYLLMAHSVTAYQQAGRLLSDLSTGFERKAGDYIELLMRGLREPATRRGHANVLAHLQGYLKKHIDSQARQELDALVQAYRRGEQPLLAPLALLKHHLARHPDQYVLNQSYLEPHPPAAALRRAL